MVILILLAIAIVLTHHLSVLVVLLMLTVLLVANRWDMRREVSNGNALGVTYIGVFLVLMLAQWFFMGPQLIRLSIEITLLGPYALVSPPSSLPAESTLVAFVLSFANILALFLVFACWATIHLTRQKIAGISIGISLAFSVLAVLVLGSYYSSFSQSLIIAYLSPHRWALYGSFFLSLIGGAFIYATISRLRWRRLVIGVLSVLILIALISASATSSFDSLPFRDNHYSYPTPFLMDSEVEIARFVANDFSGQVSSDLVFSYLFYLEGRPSDLSVNDSIGGFIHGSTWVVRWHELTDRGLVYSSGFSATYIFPSDLEAFFLKAQTNCLADTGSSSLIALP
jgi:hypothetical protein